VIEETAMIIRITELGARPFDYYPQAQIQTLERLYTDEFSPFGLTIDNLVGHPKTRVFNSLPLVLEDVATPVA
jgi:N-acetyl-anhydromuramyl-L-alanine amidase AmpD